MTKKESEYLEKSLVEYGNIHELFLKHLAKNNNADSVPTVKLEIAYDHEDIRPERLDEWWGDWGVIIYCVTRCMIILLFEIFLEFTFLKSYLLQFDI